MAPTTPAASPAAREPRELACSCRCANSAAGSMWSVVRTRVARARREPPGARDAGAPCTRATPRVMKSAAKTATAPVTTIVAPVVQMSAPPSALQPRVRRRQ